MGKTIQKLVAYIVVYLCAVIMILPFLWMLSTSFKSPTEIFAVPIRWIPEVVNLDNYRAALKGFPFWQFVGNSVTVTLGMIVGQLVTSIFAAYAFARLQFKGKNLLFLVLLSALMLPSQTIMIPMVLILKSLGLMNTLAGLIIPFSWSALIIFLFRQFFLGIPNEIEEAAFIDGCNIFGIIFRIIIPISKPVISTAVILIFVFGWNQYFWPLLILSDEKLYTLQLGLSYFSEQNMIETNWGALMAATTMAIIPVILVYLLFRKQVIQSIAFSGGKE